MVYQKKFVAVVKSGGKILREMDDNEVFLPFKSEYSILLKNLNSRRASVNISIDGEDVLGGSSIVIDVNDTFDLKGFLENNKVRSRFRFINKTKEISDYRGDRIDDGIVRIEYAFEKPVENYFNGSIFNNGIKRSPGIFDDNTYFSSNITCSVSNTKSRDVSYYNEPLKDEGITVKGSDVKQDFQTTYLGVLEEPEVITLKLKGFNKTEKVKKLVTVKSKIRCSTCGRKYKSNVKFCSNCGTNLKS